MNNLLIIRAKPNPEGKDRDDGIFLLHLKLRQEWIDIKNVGFSNVDLKERCIYHGVYNEAGTLVSREILIHLNGILKPGEILRIHSGPIVPITSLAIDDRIGADYHVYTAHTNYALNNKYGDEIGLWHSEKKVYEDKTFYDPNPRNGAVLIRVGNKLTV